jgi:SAM-dependent methyltransferase
MLDVGRRRGAELGTENVEYRVIDAQEIELETDSVDRVLCRFGYMLMPDPAAALAETRRVLRPTGKLALAVWGAPQRNPFFAIVGAALVERGHMPPPEPTGPGVFSLGSEERIRALLEGTGFDDVRTEEIPVRFVVDGVEEYMDVTGDTAGPVGLALRELPRDERDAIAARVEDGFAPFASSRGYEVPGVAMGAAAA